MRTFDASSLIYAWDNYPPDQFPPLWEWMGELVLSEEINVPQTAFDEVKNHNPDCSQWLEDNAVELLPMTNDIAQEALRIKNLLGINVDAYHPKGVGENDLFIIATAKIHGLELVSNEAVQLNVPTNLAKMKIPAVCNLQSVDVVCLSFIQLLRIEGNVFGV